MQLFGPEARGECRGQERKMTENPGGREGGTQEVYRITLLPAPRFPSSSEGPLLHFAACFPLLSP